jgi:hypothetical protein
VAFVGLIVCGISDGVGSVINLSKSGVCRRNLIVTFWPLEVR